MNKLNIHWKTSDHPSDYPTKIKFFFFREYVRNRLSYTNWVEKISKKYRKNLDWWITIPPSRNPFLTDIPKYFSILNTLDKLKNKIKYLKVESSSSNFLQILKEWTLKYKINSNNILINKKKKKLNFILFLNSTFFILFIFFYIKIFIKKKNLKKYSSNYKIILCDVFQNSLDDSRSYNNIDDRLKDRNKKFFYVPTFIIQNNIFKVFKIINQIKNKNFIFKEHYLSISDIFYSFGHLFRKKKFKVKYKKFKNWDFSNIVNEEIESNVDFYSACISIQNYCFFKRLNKNKIKIKKIINWFENQIVDKGWNLGARKFYPESEILGYQGFTYYSQYMNTNPTKYEFNSKVLPYKILTIGKIYKNPKKEFFKNAEIKVVPALNFQFLHKNIKRKNPKKILAVLSGIETLDKKLIDWINFVNKKNNFNIFVKSHPILPIKNILSNKFLKNKMNFQLSSQNLNELLYNSKIVICSGPTSATLEAIALGCYLIVPVLDPNDEMNFKHLKISKKLYKLVFNKEELFNELFKSDKNHIFKKKNNVIKSDFFEKLNKSNEKIFF